MDTNESDISDADSYQYQHELAFLFSTNTIGKKPEYSLIDQDLGEKKNFLDLNNNVDFSAINISLKYQ